MVMVEQDRAAFHALQQNCEKLACEQVTLRCESALDFLRRSRADYNVIFLDPPFQSDYLVKVLPLVADRLAPGGLVYVETGTPFQPDAVWQVTRHAKAGNVHYQLLQLVPNVKQERDD